MTTHRKLASYKQVQVNTASPGKKVVMLYDAVLKHLRDAEAGFDEDVTGGYEKIHNGIQGASRILLELKLALDLGQGGDVARRLDDLYHFWLLNLSEANMAKSKPMVQDILLMVAEVRDGWTEALRGEEAGNER